MAQDDGDFDNFTYVNEHNMTEVMNQVNASGCERPSTEILDLKNSFAGTLQDTHD